MLCVPGAAAQQLDPEDVPSVGVQPIGTASDDPNSGQWFIAALSPGESVRFTAGVANPALIPQRVKLYLADLDFTADGTPEVAEVSDEVGTWGSVDQTTLEVPPRSVIPVGFTIRAPATADPGDHVGVIVAEGEPTQTTDGRALVVKRVATRIYITLPGDAVSNFSIEKVDLQRDSSFFTKEITTSVIVRNTGRVRIAPTVLINGTKADGPELVMSRSVEQYVATTKVPIWGGPQSVRVDVRTKVGSANGAAGPFRQARASTFVMPWVLLIGVVAAVVVAFFGRRAWRKRGSKYAEMRADMKRIERLLAEQRAGAEAGGRGNGSGKPETPEQAIRAAMKRAARAGDSKAEAKLKAKLEEHREAGIAERTSESAARPSAPASAVSAPEPEPVAVPEPQAVAGAEPAPAPAPDAPEPGPEVTLVGEATMTGHGNAPPAEADSLAVTLIRSAIERARAAGDEAEVARLQAKLEREKARR